jgi:hypothetical protein
MTRFDTIKFYINLTLNLALIIYPILCWVDPSYSNGIVLVVSFLVFFVREVHTSVYYDVDLCEGCSYDFNQIFVNWYSYHMPSFAAIFKHFVGYLKEKINV